MPVCWSPVRVDGKELVARWLHALSNRSEHSFVEVNCAAIPSELIEATCLAMKKALLLLPSGNGKEILSWQAEAPCSWMKSAIWVFRPQAKVYGLCRENKITRVGGEREIPVDVRVIAATNKNIKQELENKNFREDLYHRLSVILIDVPPLSKRLDDIPHLTNNLLPRSVNTRGKLR